MLTNRGTSEGVLPLTPGFHVIAPLLTTDSGGRMVVEKVVGKATHDNLTEDMARGLVEDVKHYYQILGQAGVYVPEQISVELVRHDGDRWGIVEKAVFCGVDLGKLILESDFQDCEKMVQGILVNLERLFKLSDLGCYEVEVSLDPKPSNWVYGDEGQVYYIDFIPPRFREIQGKILLEFPRGAPLSQADWNFLYRRYFDRRGLLHILFVQLCRLRPEFRLQFRNLISSFLERIGDKLVLDFFESLPAQRVALFLQAESSKFAIEEIINGFGPESADDIRDVALQLTAKKTPMLDEIFHLSHVDMSGRLNANDIGQIKELLRQLLNRNQNGCP